jgi:hypothetical protein
MICQHQPPGTDENWQTIPPTDRNTFVSVWTLDDGGTPDLADEEMSSR